MDTQAGSVRAGEDPQVFAVALQGDDFQALQQRPRVGPAGDHVAPADDDAPDAPPDLVSFFGAKADLEQGINLAAEFLDNPFSAPFQKLSDAVAQKEAFETFLVKSVVSPWWWAT